MIRSLRLFAVFVCLIAVSGLALSDANAAFVSTSGLTINGEGTVGHGAVEPAPAPFDAVTGFNLGIHPASAYIASIYTLLCSADVFNTADGSEAALASHPAPFAGSGLAGPYMNALGVSGMVYYAFRGLVLDYMSPDDFTFDLSTNVETRIYRGGEIEFYFDSPDKAVGPILFARATDMVVQFNIDWNALGIMQTLLSATNDTGPEILTHLVGMVGISSTPVQLNGVTSEGGPYTGAYGMYNDDGTTWEFTSEVVANESATWGAVKSLYFSD